MMSMVVERQGKVCEFGYDAEHTAVVRTAHQLREEEEEKEKSYRKEWEENSDERKVRGNGRVKSESGLLDES